ncbi:MAG TPA: hypothetical protein VLB04_04510 [Methanotrichaceae archaeon]|nr:hypothetical protein [Methanotrichaceae archaeon]
MLRRIGAVLLLLLISTGFAYAAGEPAMNPNGYYIENTHEFQQDVSGEGYVMVYQYVNTNNLSLKNYMHGSGVMDMATLINSQQKPEKSVDYFPEKVGSTYQNADKLYTNKNYDSVIGFTEQNEMTQSPQGFVYGTGWYASHPVQYNSLLKERTDARNYQAGAQMLHQIEYARGFRKDIGVELNCTGPLVKAKGAGIAQMRIEEDVLQGTVHIGATLTQLDKMGKKVKTNGWVKNPLIYIDENYIGNFKIKKNMKINAAKKDYKEVTDWLPCCFGGYFDMSDYERKLLSEDGIFDCTCRAAGLKTYKPAWDGSTAQFPNEVYQYKP